MKTLSSVSSSSSMDERSAPLPEGRESVGEGVLGGTNRSIS